MGLFAGIDRGRFKKQVHPGDQLHLAVAITRVRGLIAKANAVDNLQPIGVPALSIPIATNSASFPPKITASPTAPDLSIP